MKKSPKFTAHYLTSNTRLACNCFENESRPVAHSLPCPAKATAGIERWVCRSHLHTGITAPYHVMVRCYRQTHFSETKPRLAHACWPACHSSRTVICVKHKCRLACGRKTIVGKIPWFICRKLWSSLKPCKNKSLRFQVIIWSDQCPILVD